MAGRSIPLSVRISADDATFLASFNANGAATLSEKVRSLISEAKQRHLGEEDYAQSLEFIQETLAPSFARLRNLESQNDKHSALLAIFAHWIPDIIAYWMAGVPQEDSPDAAENLMELEAAIANRIFDLIESVLRLGVLPKSRCYQPEIIAQHMAPILELNNIIAQPSSNTKETPND
ncbi:MAG: hypothetical protein OXG24_13680 [Gammaproteobacteria bacterium]|nr:hypothetical protein [Gammaproteobacteria bacterium]